MEKSFLTKYYPRQQSIGAALSTFIDDISQFYGGNLTIQYRKPITHSEYFYVEILHFSNGLQIKATLERNNETFEITAKASRELNYTYLSHFIDDDFDYLCSLVIQRHFELKTIIDSLGTTNKQEDKELQTLELLLPKLLILTGKSRENSLKSFRKSS